MMSTTQLQKNQQSATASSRLAETGYAGLQNVRCESEGDRMILSGIVPSYYMKQIAQTVAGQIDGVEQIDNRLEVRSARGES